MPRVKLWYADMKIYGGNVSRLHRIQAGLFACGIRASEIHPQMIPHHETNVGLSNLLLRPDANPNHQDAVGLHHRHHDSALVESGDANDCDTSIHVPPTRLYT